MELVQQLADYGAGRRGLHDALFSGDKPPARLGVRDLDEEGLCHEVIQTTCSVPGCSFSADCLLDAETHYNAAHRYACSQCRKVLLSPHLLDLHIQETHDSFFAVMAAKKASYCCYIEECKEKFLNAEERLYHCVETHKLPRDFRYDKKPKTSKKSKAKKKIVKTKTEQCMDADDNSSEVKLFTFNNSKGKGFSKYTGRTFTKENEKSGYVDVNMDGIVEDLKESLP